MTRSTPALLMEQAQVFASAWSLVGGCFDSGNLLAEAEAAKAELRQMIESTFAADLVPGVMHCAKCKFKLIRSNLNVRAGTITAGDSKTEPCPNGCGPLWPVTWEQEARAAYATTEDLFNQLQAAEAKYNELAATHAQVPLNEATGKILGRPNFTCARIADVLRKGGLSIPKKAEAEQAATIHYMLNKYLQHGDAWASIADGELARMAMLAAPIDGDHT